MPAFSQLVDFYNKEIKRFIAAGCPEKIDAFIDTDPEKISWSDDLKQNLARKLLISYEDGILMTSVYRPFAKQWLYFGRNLNERVYQIPRIFPHQGVENRVICVTGVGARGLSVLIVDMIPCLDGRKESMLSTLSLREE